MILLTWHDLRVVDADVGINFLSFSAFNLSRFLCHLLSVKCSEIMRVNHPIFVALGPDVLCITAPNLVEKLEHVFGWHVLVIIVRETLGCDLFSYF